MADYSVTLLENIDEFENFAETGLPPGIRAVTFDSTSNPFQKLGLFSLIQLFILILLKTPGRDIFDEESGGGLKKLLGRPVSPKNINAKKGEISLSVSRTEDQMLEAQAASTAPSAERLQSATLQQASFDYTSQAWSITIRIVSDAGSAADVLL